MRQKFPAQLDAASAIAFCLDALIYHSTLSHLQVFSFARLSVHKPKFPSQMDAAPELHPPARPFGNGCRHSKMPHPRLPLQAISPCGGLLTCFSADADFFSSPLLKGSATHSLQAAPPLQQKPAILVSQVKRLELLTDSDEPALVNIIGGILIALYSRSRWMDLQRASSLELDAPEGVTYFGNTFYQLNTSEYKTSKSGGKSRLILPLTLPIFSLSGCHWFQNWLAARDRLGLPVQGAITPPLIRSVGAQGDTPRPFNTSEVNSLLAIAKPGEPVPTSRSLKATCLSWVAKAGVSPPLRKLLGYHVDATELSVNTYSRDLLAPPLRELVRVLSLIASGAFSPDTTRSGYFAFNDPGTHDGNDAAPAVLSQPPSESVSADTTAVTAESALGPTSPQSPRASDSDSSSSDEVVPESTEEDLGDPDESPAAALVAV